MDRIDLQAGPGVDEPHRIQLVGTEADAAFVVEAQGRAVERDRLDAQRVRLLEGLEVSARTQELPPVAVAERLRPALQQAFVHCGLRGAVFEHLQSQCMLVA